MIAVQLEEKKDDHHLFLKKIVHEISLCLPIQNPIPFFVHNNPIQFWESLPFEEGLLSATLIYENSGFKCNRSKIRTLEDLAIPVAMSYIDQGLNQWNCLNDNGLWSWFCEFTATSLSIKNSILPQLKKDILIIKNDRPENIIIKALLKNKIPSDRWKDYINALVMHFKGWSGMIFLLEKNISLFPIQKKNISLIDWIAILVTISDQLNIEIESNYSPFKNKRENQIKETLKRINKSSFLLYERMIDRFQKHLNFIQSSNLNHSTHSFKKKYEVQALFCIDDREESVRRHLENTYPECQTFSTVGFFGVAFKLKPHKHVVYQPQCPPVIQAQKTAVELINNESKLSLLAHNIFHFLNSARFRVYEPILSLASPFIYPLALLIRSLSPTLYACIRNLKFSPDFKDTHFIFNKDNEFTLEEKSKIVEDILKSSGLIKKLCPLVVVIGHGSTTSNNPFNKSYGCGACSGQSGYPNARLFCSFANDFEVRNHLAQKGFIIPSPTQFLATYHDTCSDQILFSTDTALSSENEARLNQLRKAFNESLKKNTQERFKIFKISPSENPNHRAQNWSEPRPEFGHSKMSMSIFGPRWLTENFDLGRTSFLISYDPKVDSEDGQLLEYVINNSLPVCANINLDYFTSTAFPKAFGAGSKLPLNIASGIGLMTGSKSDLKIGLARQMVDQHTPMRLLCFVYSKKQTLEKVIHQSQRLKNLITNEWIHLIRIDPEDLKLEPITKEIANAIKSI